MKRLYYLILFMVICLSVLAQAKGENKRLEIKQDLIGKWTCLSRQQCNKEGVAMRGDLVNNLFREIDAQGKFTDYVLFQEKIEIGQGDVTVVNDSTLLFRCDESKGKRIYPTISECAFKLSKSKKTLIICLKLSDGEIQGIPAYYEEIWERVVEGSTLRKEQREQPRGMFKPSK